MHITPTVTITAPVEGQVLAAGQPIDVRFTISGVDAVGSVQVPFSLVSGNMKVQGQAQVRAFLSNGNLVARTVSIPNDANPFVIPDPQYATAAAVVTPGSKRITLHLNYNDGSDVLLQREGVVNVIIQ